MAKTEMMPIISFAVICGVALLMMGPRGEKIQKACGEISNMMTVIISMILTTTPYGAFGLMSVTIGKFGTSILGPVLKFFALDWTGQILIQVFMFNGILLLLGKVNPFKFWKRAMEPWVVAFTTGSSMAALPFSMEVANDMGIPKETASFILPLGATANMNGLCCYMALLVVFAAQVHGIELSVSSMAFIVAQCVILAVGAAALPASGVISAMTLFTMLDFPLIVVGIVAGAYKIVDGIHTTTNSVGDLVVAVGVSSSEQTLDLAKYNNPGNSLNSAKA
jgi:Na+/H+-dicarboxylate symporter